MQMPHEMVDMVEFEATWSRLERVVDLLQDEMRMCLEASNGPSWPMMHLKQLNQRAEELQSLVDMANSQKQKSDIYASYETYMLRKELKDAKII